MKTKLLKVAGLLLACFVLFISCAADVSGSSDDKNEKDVKKSEINFITKDVDYNIQTMAAALGDVNKIVDSDGHEVTGSGVVNHRSAARFMNGEEIYITYPNLLYFYAYLVEYNEFTNSDVLNWMETNEFNSVTDCSFHQHYESVDYNSQKKYVEVCSYVDANNKAIYCEIRIHYPRTNGDTDREGKFYGKACNFDPTFTIDTNVGKNIKTKEEAIYVYGDGWNEGVNPWAGKKFRFVKFERIRNDKLQEPDPESQGNQEDEEIVFKDDVIVYTAGNQSYTIKYFWNAKYKCIYMLGTGFGCPSRWELNGNQLKCIWGVKYPVTRSNGDIEVWEDYQYTYYELIQ